MSESTNQASRPGEEFSRAMPLEAAGGGAIGQLSERRANAIKDAKDQAQQLADAAGLTLGDIQSINFSESSPIPFMEGKGGGGAAATTSAAVPIQPGHPVEIVAVNGLTLKVKPKQPPIA